MAGETDDSANAEGPIRVEGTIKWFDPARGYGFLEADDGLGDVLVHASCLRPAGHSYAPEGARMICLTMAGERGRQAVEILQMSGGIEAPPRPRRFHPESEPAQDMRDAVVKWFDAGKGYGFLNCDGIDGDVFVHAVTIHRAGLDELKPGEAVQARCSDGPRGLLASEVRPGASAH